MLRTATRKGLTPATAAALSSNYAQTLPSTGGCAVVIENMPSTALPMLNGRSISTGCSCPLMMPRCCFKVRAGWHRCRDVYRARAAKIVQRTTARWLVCGRCSNCKVLNVDAIRGMFQLEDKEVKRLQRQLKRSDGAVIAARTLNGVMSAPDVVMAIPMRTLFDWGALSDADLDGIEALALAQRHLV